MTKRSLILFAIFMIILGAAFTANAYAASCGGVDTAIINCSEEGEGAVNHIFLLILDIMTIGIGILGVVGISVSGIQYLTAADDATKATKAKRRIFEIIIGLALYALLWAGLEWLMPGGRLNITSSDTANNQASQSNNTKNYSTYSQKKP